MISDRQCGIGSAYPTRGRAQSFKCLGACHLVDQMAIDVQDGRAILLNIDEVIVPDLLK
jgi:hypothetical protein